MRKRFLLWNNPRQAIYMLMTILLFIGGVNVYSASFVANGLKYIGQHFLFAALGMVVIYIIRSIGYKRILNKHFLRYCYILTFLMLLYVDYMGIVNKGATRWIYVGEAFSIQPSEIAKLVVILLAARYFGSAMKRGQSVALFTGECGRVTYATLAVAALVVKQPDLGTAAIIVALMIGMFILAGLAKKWITGIVGTGLVGAVLLTVTSTYRWERIKVWFNPWLDERGNGYQMVQSLLAIGSGGLTGTDWGRGAGKFYLPEAHTDFAFAIFCQENGFIGVALLLLLFVVMGAAFYRITISTRDPKGFLLAAGVTLLVIGQALANMAMVCGLLPVIGVPLIFISYGGSSMLISMCAVGLLLSVYDEEEGQMALDAQTPEERRASFRFVHSRR